jgi:hypothetical protein
MSLSLPSVSLKDSKIIIHVAPQFLDAAEDSVKFTFVLLGMWLAQQYILKSNPMAIQSYMMQALPVVLGLVFYHLIVRRLIIVMPKPGQELHYFALKRFR